MRAGVWWGAGTHVWVQRPEDVWGSALPLSLISLRQGLPLNLELGVFTSYVGQQVPRDPPLTLPCQPCRITGSPRLSVWIAWSSCWHSKHRYPRGHLPDPYYMFSILVLQSAISPKSPGSFLMESGLRTGHQVRSLLFVSQLLGPPS